MEKKSVVGWIGFLVFILIFLGIAGVVLGISIMVKADENTLIGSMTAGAIFFLQATLAFGYALRSISK